MSDLTRGLHALDHARPRYNLAHKMFDGTAREIAANDAVRPHIERSGAKYRANVARKAVKSRTNRLKVAALTVSDDETKALTERLTDEIVEPNDFDVELPRFIEKVCEFGDAYLLRWPNPKAQLNADGTASKVDIFVRDPMSMRAIYDRENEREIEYVIDSWCTGYGDDERTRVNLYYEDRVERWISIERLPAATHRTDVTGATESTGVTWADDLFRPYTGDATEDDDPETAHIITYDHGLPIEHGRTERPYGRPEHYDAYGPQNAITKIMATHLAGIDWNGWPYRYQLAEANTKGAGLADWGDGSTREAPNAPRSTAAKATPGTMNKLSNVRAVGQLDGSPANVFLDPLVAYIRLLGEVTDTPMNVTDPTGQVESGQSRTARIDDLLSRVSSLQDQLAGPIAGICEGALAMLGEPDRTVTVTWAPSSKVSDTEGWTAVQAKEAAGVPERVALIEAGYLPDDVDAWGKTLDGKLSVLDRIAATGLAMGQAVTVMGLPAEQASEIFGKFVAEVLTDDNAG